MSDTPPPRDLLGALADSLKAARVTASTPGDGELPETLVRDLHRAQQMHGMAGAGPRGTFEVDDVRALVAEVRKLREQRDRAVADVGRLPDVMRETVVRLKVEAQDAALRAARAEAELASRPAPRVITTREELDQYDWQETVVVGDGIAGFICDLVHGGSPYDLMPLVVVWDEDSRPPSPGDQS